MHSKKTPKFLTPSQGNGRGGCYATLDTPLPKMLQRVMHVTRHWIENNAGKLEKPLHSKALLFRYGFGGVNYAHHDACGDFQALLMLSEPGVDYKGGVFYLGHANPPFTVKLFSFTMPGELLVFRANRGNGKIDYLHGTT